MKTIFSVMLSILILSFVGCKEQTTSIDAINTFEKRIPISTHDSIKRDTTKTNRRNQVENEEHCLNLTRQEDSVIRRFILESKRCEIDCKKEFNDDVNNLRRDYNSKLSEYKGLVKDSLIKKRIQIITFEFRQTLRELEKEHKERMAECKKLLYLNIESILNEKQLTLWNIWKATGKIPCEVKP